MAPRPRLVYRRAPSNRRGRDTGEGAAQAPPSPGIADLDFDSFRTLTQPVETINVHVHEVNLVLSVTDRNGKVVNNLRPSDLTILDNGVEQTKLTFFKRETDLPIKIALVLDTSASMAQQRDAENAAIGSFLKRVSLPLDSVMLFAFNQNVQLRSPVTNNWGITAKLVKSLKPGGETALYDAVSDASDSHPTRRIVAAGCPWLDRRATSRPMPPASKTLRRVITGSPRLPAATAIAGW